MLDKIDRKLLCLLQQDCTLSLQALAAIRERTTLVVIAHRLSTIVEADTILVLHRGQAVERGTHQQLLAAQGRYWQMYQLQLVGEELAASVHEEPGPAA
ncbi:TPA: hypothetical protein G8Q73_000290 [Salmonella enterica]|uniref:Uncharacterized protein n=2 Tax=Salmonella enterica TaxID=28901 RepID=A0A754F1J0_SALER|nr:hypothetical protein [Salmonella enterica subsp. enterica serovar Abortusequi]EFQ9517673.1 hypothetical protein [Salmonella enterica]MZI60512.1 hypothetical protein [Salmonella sp. XN2]QEY70052.1 hypothetical protein FXN66_06760 [Salmonella enterica subsp. enterica]EFR7364527.1 hypothetical protein [Salmonella enterica]